MFSTACIPMIISEANLKREMDDEESYRVADIALIVEPFSLELASELGEFIARHLWNEHGEMRAEMSDISLSLRQPSQRIIVASAPDAPALATLRDVRIGDLAVVRKGKGDRSWYRATIEARIDLREREIREFLFHHFGEFRCFTFMDEQMSLIASPDQEFVDLMRALGGEVSLTGPDGTGVRITQDTVETVGPRAKAKSSAE